MSQWPWVNCFTPLSFLCATVVNPICCEHGTSASFLAVILCYSYEDGTAGGGGSPCTFPCMSHEFTIVSNKKFLKVIFEKEKKTGG